MELFNNGVVIQHGYVNSISNNSTKTVTFPIAQPRKYTSIAGVIWQSHYTNHTACQYVSLTQMKVINYRSYSDQTNSINIHWITIS